MSFTLRSTSNTFAENERLTRKRQTASSSTTTTATLNRFLSFNENKSSSVENRRRLIQSTPNLIELLEEDEDETEDYQALCHECNTCSKIFASEYGLNHHINMYHPNQSILCPLCNITFRSHRSLKTHQQRRHSTIQTKLKLNHSLLPNYSYISSYLVIAFSSKQFPIMAKYACEQQRLPLGIFSSQLYQCQYCSTSFPCSRSLNYHLLNKHEQYEYKICQAILSDLSIEVECTSRTVDNDDDDIESIKLNLAKQASQFGLIDKNLSKKHHIIKKEQNHLIYPKCQHENRTCANLCLQYLSSYSKLIKNYPYTITTIPKGNPFAQGPIVSTISSINNIYSNGSSSMNDSNTTNELVNGRQKRKSIKHIDDSVSPQSKKKVSSNVTTINTKTTRTSSNNKVTVVKQQIEQTTKTNDTKPVSVEQSSFAVAVTTTSTVQRKILPKENYIRSTSLSSNSSTSTSTRSSTIKSSSSSTNLTQQTIISSQRTLKRSLSPKTVKSFERSSRKRRRSREQKEKLTSSASTAVIRIDDDDENDIEQENDDDEDNEDGIVNDDPDVIPIKFEVPNKQRQSKKRQASSGSIEYVQTLNNDQQSTLSLNNIENIKSKTKINDEEIIICRSPPSVRRVISSSNKNHSKTTVSRNGTKKSNVQQSPPDDEHVRVRCKICGVVLEGRSRFSKHVITMHSHLLDKKISGSKQQQQQQTAIVR
ncbi:unnamed protein product [Adineta steineri]|uniref:C2H2-type domain-containing protein n=1 Tax=Adineta steineri TaxID=433720 RepID=A0A813RKK6_9BILA|nr:unnamed protein product [Adineta steineri]